MNKNLYLKIISAVRAARKNNTKYLFVSINYKQLRVFNMIIVKISRLKSYKNTILFNSQKRLCNLFDLVIILH